MAPLPVGDLPGWTQIVAEDFDTDCASGAFRATYPAMTTEDNIHDTSGIGMYRSTGISVHNSMLDVLVGWDGTDYRVAKILPNRYAGQLGGKFTIQIHCDFVAQYKVIPILIWSARDVWADGEIDFYENGIGNPTQPLTIAFHTVGNPSQGNQTTVPGLFTGPATHVVDFEWVPTTPGSLTASFDGVVVRTTTNAAVIPILPMRWIIQIEVADTSGATTPSQSNTGHVYLDWVAQYTYTVPGTGTGVVSRVRSKATTTVAAPFTGTGTLTATSSRGGNTGRVSRVQSKTVGGLTGRVTKVQSRTASLSGRVTRIQSRTTTASSGSQQVNPYDVVNLGAGTWTQTTGPVVTVPIFTAPAVPPPGVTLTFTQGAATQIVQVLGHTLFRSVGNQWVPYQIQQL